MDKFINHKHPKPLLNNEPIYVYTDGACINNGKPNARAGIGVYFGENDSRNISWIRIYWFMYCTFRQLFNT